MNLGTSRTLGSKGVGRQVGSTMGMGDGGEQKKTGANGTHAACVSLRARADTDYHHFISL